MDVSAREIVSVRVVYRDGGTWEYAGRALAHAPAPARIALARALVADMSGVVVAPREPTKEMVRAAVDRRLVEHIHAEVRMAIHLAPLPDDMIIPHRVEVRRLMKTAVAEMFRTIDTPPATPA